MVGSARQAPYTKVRSGIPINLSYVRRLHGLLHQWVTAAVGWNPLLYRTAPIISTSHPIMSSTSSVNFTQKARRSSALISADQYGSAFFDFASEN